MAKKPRSQRRKKGKALPDNDDGGGGDDNMNNVEFLPEEHTIADSVTTDFSSHFEEDFMGKSLLTHGVLLRIMF